MPALEYADKLKRHFGDLLLEPVEFRREISIVVANADRIHEVLEHAKTHLAFDYLIDISSVDNYGDDPRFTVVYELSGLQHKCHLRLKTFVSENSPEIPTASSIWRTADWHEREIYDMMGIRFRGHPDLRRILMWDGYPYFPLRKDFPLAGKPTDLPEIAFTNPAPLEGGPFVTTTGVKDAIHREPRARETEDTATAQTR